MALQNQGNTPLPAVAGTQEYTLAVVGGTIFYFTSRDLKGTFLGSAAAFVPSGQSSNMAPTALATVGAGVLLAAALYAGLIVRTGPIAAFTDTTDTAANIQAAWPGGNIGSAFEFTYRNTTAFDATLAAGAGVTLSGPIIVPRNSSARFLATWTGVNTVTITTEYVASVSLPNEQYATINATTGSLAARKITGAKHCVLVSSNAVPGAQLVRTAAQMLADTPNGQVGLTWSFRIANTGAGIFTLTADGGATVTLVGTMTVAQNTYRDFTASFDSATTVTITSIGSGTYD